jgi:hypothetical protein
MHVPDSLDLVPIAAYWGKVTIYYNSVIHLLILYNPSTYRAKGRVLSAHI